MLKWTLQEIKFKCTIYTLKKEIEEGRHNFVKKSTKIIIYK